MKTLEKKEVDFEKARGVCRWTTDILKMKRLFTRLQQEQNDTSKVDPHRTLLLTVMVSVVLANAACFETVKWSPDGQRIAYSYTADGKTHIAIQDQDTGHISNLHRFANRSGLWTWSADGEHLIAVDQSEANANLLVISAVAQEITQRYSLPKDTQYFDVELLGDYVFLMSPEKLSSCLAHRRVGSSGIGLSGSLVTGSP